MLTPIDWIKLQLAQKRMLFRSSGNNVKAWQIRRLCGLGLDLALSASDANKAGDHHATERSAAVLSVCVANVRTISYVEDNAIVLLKDARIYL